jgi:tyrosyl-tRNA synthetase
MVALMSVLHFHVHGHRVLPLVSEYHFICKLTDLIDTSEVGGATGAVGDPGGRATERTLMSTDTINENKTRLAAQLERFFHLGTERARKYLEISTNALAPPKVLDNLAWTGHLTLLDFLRDVGKHAKVNVMLTRDRLVDLFVQLTNTTNVRQS